MNASLPRLKKIGNPTVPHAEGVAHFLSSLLLFLAPFSVLTVFLS